MLLASALFIAWVVAVAWCDCRDRRIPNGLVLAGAVAAFGCAAVRASPFGVALAQVGVGLLVGLIALLPFFLLGAMGAADVKVFAVLGAWCGASALFDLWVVASIAAALHAVALIVAAHVRSSGSAVCSPSRNGRLTFAVGERRATPYAALLVGAAWLHWIAGLVQGGVR